MRVLFLQLATSLTKNIRILLQHHVASLSEVLSSTEEYLLDRRRKLEARISAYEQRISLIMKLDDDTL